MNDPETHGTPVPPPASPQDQAPAMPPSSPGTQATPPPPPSAIPPSATPPPASPPPASWAAPDATVGPAPGVEWAGYGERLIGYIIDGLILSVIITILALLFVPLFVSGIDLSDIENPTFSAGFFASVALFTVLTAIVGVIYFPFFWVRGGQTPGQRVFGIRVVRDQDGGPLSWGAAILRLIGYWISGLVFSLGYIWVLLDKRRRGWFDLLGGTVVVKDPVRR